jgi:hypothetical protein
LPVGAKRIRIIKALIEVEIKMNFASLSSCSRFARTAFAAGLALMLACSLVSAGCKTGIDVRNPVTLSPIADPQRIYSEFLANEQAAINKYEGKKFQFPDVYVDKVPELADLLMSVGEYYVQSGMVKFRSESPDPLAEVQVGQTVYIVGTVTGMQFGYLNIQIEEIVAPPAPPIIPY